MDADSSVTEPEDSGSPVAQPSSEGANAPVEEVGEQPEEVFREAVNDGREVSFLTKTINPYLQCGLCSGYLRDAHSIMECLHCFCYSCIVKFFYKEGKSSNTCPSCGIHLGTEPILAIHPDHTLQNIVDKVFPEFARREYEEETRFNLERDLPPPKAIISPSVYATRHIPTAAAEDQGAPEMKLETLAETRSSTTATTTTSGGSSSAVTTGAPRTEAGASTTTTVATPAMSGDGSTGGSGSTVRVGVKRGIAAVTGSGSTTGAAEPVSPASSSGVRRQGKDGFASQGASGPHGRKKDKKKQKTHKSAGQMITFKLFRDDRAAETEQDGADSMGPLVRPTLKTSSSITVMHLKKFLAAKLQLDSVAQVDVLCRGARLGNEYTLEYVKKTIWELHHGANEDNQLVLTYRQKTLDHMHTI